ncbi:hypothetical protein [Hymenobacter lapidiphilus]|uniref:Uncharacterized protein n=1 Tax=Hymenobacter lapidiphilus TaxID=2608003 RepID=A0A7Y7U5H5_9BACT|nr:hypothetical protein [Hymenobacter lapidiphilus]NVO30764.1 hypothetical protein [Hymenobacter lapidiphilus]
MKINHDRVRPLELGAKVRKGQGRGTEALAARPGVRSIRQQLRIGRCRMNFT